MHTTLAQIQLRPPPIRAGLVDRPKLIAQLESAQDARTITIVAPAGYGKTTLMSMWKDHETRAVAWLGLDRYGNDPATLLAHIVAAFQRAGMLADVPADDLRIPSNMVISHGVARVADALDSQGATGILMLDHAEAIRSRASNDTIVEIAARLPPGVQLAISSRTGVRLPVARLRAQGSLLELTPAELAMDEDEALELLTKSGVDVHDEFDELLRQTEGWPVGLYLAAIAVRAGSSRQSAARISGRDRYLADYLRDEVLGRVTDEHLTFLLRTSILDRYCGPLCDAVLGTTGAARTIEQVEASNLLVVPLDRTRDWYRYHHLLQEFLQDELTRREPEIVATLHGKAAEWFETNSMPEEAITHAQAAADGDMVARIVDRVGRRILSLGRAKTVFEWLRWFERTGRIGNYPRITAMAGMACALSGDAIGAQRWADALPSGGDPIPTAEILRAVLARNGLAQVRANGQAAQRAAPTAKAAGLVVEGLAHLWDGDIDHADSLLSRAVSAGERDPGLPAMTLALGGRASIAVDCGEWEDAAEHVSRSLDVIRENGLDRYLTSGLAFAVASRCAAHQGQIELARRRASRATNIRPLLTTATPGVSVFTLLEMARAHLALSDVTGARTLVRQAAGILLERPDLGLLAKHLDEMKAQLDDMTSSAVGASALTTAELRLLPFLVTHLSFPEIGERLYISRHTVKTQAMSIYRKLGASSRSEAVHHATEAGLLSI